MAVPLDVRNVSIQYIVGDIKNIGIQHNREYIGGDMTVGFWDEASKTKAAEILTGKGYILHGI